MGEWGHFALLRRYSLHYRLVFLSTFFLTVVFDLTVAMEVGIGLACVLFVKRMSALFQIEPISRQSDAAVFHVAGSLFFGTAPKMDLIVDTATAAREGFTLTLELSQLHSLDTTGLEVLEQVQELLADKAGTLRLLNVQAHPYSLLQRTEFLSRRGVEAHQAR